MVTFSLHTTSENPLFNTLCHGFFNDRRGRRACRPPEFFRPFQARHAALPIYTKADVTRVTQRLLMELKSHFSRHKRKDIHHAVAFTRKKKTTAVPSDRAPTNSCILSRDQMATHHFHVVNAACSSAMRASPSASTSLPPQHTAPSRARNPPHLSSNHPLTVSLSRPLSSGRPLHPPPPHTKNQNVRVISLFYLFILVL